MKGTILQACAPTGVQVESDDFFGLKLLAAVAGGRATPFRAVGANRKEKTKKITKVYKGLDDESKKSLENALETFRDCQEKIKIVQARLTASTDQTRELLVKWNNTQSFYQIGQENKTDRIYTINMWISGVRNFSTNAPIHYKCDEKLQVNLMNGRGKILRSRTVRISDPDCVTGLQVSVKSSVFKFYHFLENAFITIKRSNGEEREVGFLDLPDHIATSCDIDFSKTNHTEMDKDSSQRLKLRILMYLELSWQGNGESAFRDEMLRRKFELSLGDQSLLPLCWSMKKKQERSRVIELSPTSLDTDNLAPLDLTRRSEILHRNAPTMNTEALKNKHTKSSDSEAELAEHFDNPKPNVDSDFFIELDGEEESNDMESLDSEPRTEAHDSKQQSGANSDSGIDSDHSGNDGGIPSPEVRTRDVVIAMTDAEKFQMDVLHPARSSPSSKLTASATSTVESSATFTVQTAVKLSSAMTPLSSKRHKRRLELEEMIEALEKNLTAAEEKSKSRKMLKKSPSHDIIRQNTRLGLQIY